MLNRIIAIHPTITGGLIVGSFSTYFYNGYFWHYNLLNEKPLSFKEYLKKHGPGIASNGVNHFIIGSLLGSFTLLATKKHPIQNILAISLSIGFCVIERTIDLMI